MISMKVVVHRNEDIRKVISMDHSARCAEDHQQQLIFLDRRSSRDTRIVFGGINKRALFHKAPESLRPAPSNISSSRRSRRKNRRAKYRMKIKAKSDLVIVTKKVADLSINISSASKDESNKNSIAPRVIQLRKPVLQLSTQDEGPSSTNPYSLHPDNLEKSKLLESLVETYRCSLCPNFTVPEVYECPSGHKVCEDCWLSSSYCILCTSKSVSRRVHGLERIAGLLDLFPCRWRQQGCTQSFGPLAWRNHLHSCPYAKVKSTVHLDPQATTSQISYASYCETDEQPDDVIDLVEAQA